MLFLKGTAIVISKVYLKRTTPDSQRYPLKLYCINNWEVFSSWPDNAVVGAVVNEKTWNYVYSPFNTNENADRSSRNIGPDI